MTLEVTALNIYPVKSLGGIALEDATLLPTGLAHDRQWMLVRGDGRFVTQRERPALARVNTRLADGGIELTVDGQAPLYLGHDAGGGKGLEVTVWKDTCAAVDLGDRAAAWITHAGGGDLPLRLVRMTPGFSRPQSAPERYGTDTTTLFADGAPFLVANEASLARLNDVLSDRGIDPVPMNRFRPNIVLRGLDAFAEHGVEALRGPGYEIQPRFPCQRCVITTIDQITGLRDPDRQPFRTLSDLNPMPGKPRAPAFAENAVLASGAGAIIRVGDRLEIG